PLQDMSSASKIDQLYEISFVPADSRIPVQQFLSPFNPNFTPASQISIITHRSSQQPNPDCYDILVPAQDKHDDALMILPNRWKAAKIDEDDEALPKKRRNPRQTKLKRRYEKVDPTDGTYLRNRERQQGMITSSQEYLSSRVRSLKSIINELRFKIQELHREIIQIIRTSPTTQPSSSISQKEAEMKNVKNQLQDLERQHKQKRITSLIDDPWRLPSTPFVGVSFDPQPLPRSYTHTTSPSLNIWAAEQRRLKPSTRKEPTFSQES
ncbi:hypothetical protein Tco_0807291, partial [Tanacetum coccineum]